MGSRAETDRREPVKEIGSSFKKHQTQGTKRPWDGSRPARNTLRAHNYGAVFTSDFYNSIISNLKRGDAKELFCLVFPRTVLSFSFHEQTILTQTPVPACPWGIGPRTPLR